MKKITYILIITGLLSSSCSEEFLDLAPEANLTSGNFFKTEAHFQQALIGAYSRLRTAFNSEHNWVYGEQRSDNVHLIFNSVNRPDHITQKELAEQFLNEATHGDISSKYNNLYAAIAAANAITSTIDEAGLEDDVYKSIIGQAKFIRALCYYDLVRYFGGVPLHIGAVASASNAFLPRSSVDAVYDQVIADAADAVNKLSAPTFPQDGRATKSSARMLLGHVYLTLERYAEAVTELQAITTSGHDLLPDYASVFALENKNSIESIFEIQHSKASGLGQQNGNTWRLLPSAKDLSIVVGFSPSDNSIDGGFGMPTQEMIDSYEAGDERLEGSIQILEGTGTAPINFLVESIHSPVGYSTPVGKTSYPYVTKFVHAHDVWKQADDNFPIYRYSEVLLALAEALNELNRSNEALPYINHVRNRAGLADVTETSQSALRDIIAHENRVEFLFENKRWLDLVRKDKAIEVLNTYGTYIKANFNTTPYIFAGGYSLNEAKLLLPIPDREINIGKLTQNPGY